MWNPRLVCLFLFLIHTKAQIPSITSRLNHINADLTSSYSITNTGLNLARAICSRRNEYESIEYETNARIHKKCRLFLETSDPPSKSKCDVSLYPKWTGGSVSRQFKLVRLGWQYLVLVWREIIIDDIPKRRTPRYIPYPLSFTYHKDHLRVKVVHMPSCRSVESQELQLVTEQRDRIYETKICISSEDCSNNETEIFAEEEGQIHNLNVVVNGDESFDIYYRNAHVCGRERRCKVTYDVKTERFSPITVSPLQVKYDATLEIHPITSTRESSRIIAYAVRSLRLDDGTLQLLDVEGQTIYEHDYSWSPYNLAKGISHMALSTREEMLGFCQQPSSEPVIQCSLLDSRGRGLFGVDVSLKSSDIAVIQMRNTFDAGFLLLIGYGNSTTKNGLEALDILKVDSSGQLIDVYSGSEYKCSRDQSGVDVGLIETTAKQICYYMACTWPMPKLNVDETNWQLFSQCFDGSSEHKNQ